MHTLVRTVFSKLYTLDPDEEEAKLLAVQDDDANEGELRMSVTAKEETFVEEEPPSNEFNDALDSREKLEMVEEEQPPQSPLSPIDRAECMSCFVIASPNL